LFLSNPQSVSGEDSPVVWHGATGYPITLRRRRSARTLNATVGAVLVAPGAALGLAKR
jgi:hypothetical protein